MRWGIISDSHDHLDYLERALEIFKEEGVSLILHAGDFVSPFTARIFKKYPFQLIGVFGNNDGEKWLLSKVIKNFGGIIEEGPLKFSIENMKILLLHGYREVNMTLEIVNSLAESGIYDIILYGHTHKTDIRKAKGTTIINPGEACGYLTSKSTLVTLDLKTMEPQTIEF